MNFNLKIGAPFAGIVSRATETFLWTLTATNVIKYSYCLTFTYSTVKFCVYVTLRGVTRQFYFNCPVILSFATSVYKFLIVENAFFAFRIFFLATISLQFILQTFWENIFASKKSTLNNRSAWIIQIVVRIMHISVLELVRC